MVDFGKDFSAIPDLSFEQKNGLANLSEAIARRLVTPRGGLFYDSSYGFDIRRYLNETWTDAIAYEFTRLVQEEILKDERIVDCEVFVDATNILATRTLQVIVEASYGSADFKLVLDVNDVTVEVLYANIV